VEPARRSHFAAIHSAMASASSGQEPAASAGSAPIGLTRQDPASRACGGRPRGGGEAWGRGRLQPRRWLRRRRRSRPAGGGPEQSFPADLEDEIPFQRRRTGPPIRTSRRPSGRPRWRGSPALSARLRA
jgi:hypothetical protein